MSRCSYLPSTARPTYGSFSPLRRPRDSDAPHHSSPTRKLRPNGARNGPGSWRANQLGLPPRRSSWSLRNFGVPLGAILGAHRLKGVGIPMVIHREDGELQPTGETQLLVDVAQVMFDGA